MASDNIFSGLKVVFGNTRLGIHFPALEDFANEGLAFRLAEKIRYRRRVPTMLREIAARRHFGDCDARPVAEIRDRSDIRRAEEIGETADNVGIIDAGAAAEGNRFGPMFRLDLLHLGGDAVDRLVPVDPLPFPFAFLANSHQRIVAASRVIELLDGSGPCFRAQRAPIDRVVSIADHLPDRAVDTLDNRAAPAMAHPANCLELLDDVLP